MWTIYALLSAVFAALSAILIKAGITDVNSNLATAIRTLVVLVMSWAIVLVTGKAGEIAAISSRSLWFLILSGAATGLSWLCIYRALQMGSVSRVMPIDKLSIVITMILAFVILKEPIDAKTIIGGCLITMGVVVLLL
jgi:transporter family protein